MHTEANQAAAIKASIAISSIVGERVKLRKQSGQYYYGCCPFHDDSSPSFWVNDEIGRFGCWGCEESGDLIDYVMAYEGCTFPEALDRLDSGYAPSRWPHAVRSPSTYDVDARIECARRIWDDASPIKRTPAEEYLASRALRPENLPDLEFLRFARLSFDGSADLHPALIAAIQTVDGEFAGIQRTYLTEDGQKLDPHNARRSLGRVKGNSIRIADRGMDERVVYICEGLEDGLSLSRMYDKGPVLVAAGAGMLRHVELPASCECVIIGADNDATGLAAAEEAAEVFRMRGLEAFLVQPSWQHKDWNDYVRYWDNRIDDIEDAENWPRG